MSFPVLPAPACALSETVGGGTADSSLLHRAGFGFGEGLGGAGGVGPEHVFVQPVQFPVAVMPAWVEPSHQFAGWQSSPLTGLLRCTQGWPPHLLLLRESVAATHAAQPCPLSFGHAAAPTTKAPAPAAAARWTRSRQARAWRGAIVLGQSSAAPSGSCFGDRQPQTAPGPLLPRAGRDYSAF